MEAGFSLASSFSPAAASAPAWYCLRSEPKHEHIAAAALAKIEGVSSFCPRIRFRKATRRGAIWFTEAMFPGYLFACFDYAPLHRAVRYANGVSTIVQFGAIVPSLDAALIEILRASCQAEGDLMVIDQTPRSGDEITIAAGAFQGLETIVHQVLPARARLQVLLEILGRTVPAEITSEAVVLTRSRPSATN